MMMELASTINYKNFHIVANQACEQAIKQQGTIHQINKIDDQAEDQTKTIELWQTKLRHDTRSNKGSFLMRLMKIFPNLKKRLGQLITFDTNDKALSINNAFNLIENTLQRRITNQLKKFQKDSKNEIRKLEQQCSAPKRNQESKRERINHLQQSISYIAQAYSGLCNGLTNAYKTYIGLAKLATQKLLSKGKSISAKELKQLITNNRQIMSRMAGLAFPLLILFDNMNGIKFESASPYDFQSDNFKLIENDSLMVPTQKFLRNFIKKASNPRTMIEQYCTQQEGVGIFSLFRSMKNDLGKEHRCIAFKGGLMDRFFDQMDAMIGKVVDLHFA